MTAKAVAAKTVAKKRGRPAKAAVQNTEAAPIALDNPNMIAGDSLVIDINQLDVSPFDAQARRRAHFTDADLDELGRSIIGTGGFIHAPVVRKVGRRYQVVAGERRFLAAKRVGYKTVEVKVAVLDDEQVRGMQLVENLQRKELHPVDEGFDYQDLMKLKGWDVNELALQVGKSPDYVLNRIKLTGLIEEIRKDVSAGIVPLGHALEIAKFPDHEVQKEIYEEYVFDGWSDDKDMVRPLKDLISEINDQITLRLKDAPFDTTATNLRDDGLACGACERRTGAAPGLFKEYKLAKEDSCLDKACFEGKKERLVQLTRSAIAQDAGLDVDDVPTYDPRTQRCTDAGVYGDSDVNVVDEKQAGKVGVMRAVSTAPSTFGKVVLIKKKQSTGTSSIGKGGHSSAPASNEKSPAERAAFYKRKEEIWNCSVAEAVRWRVFAIAAVRFSEFFKVQGGGDNFVLAMAAKLWNRYRGNYEAVLRLVAGTMDVKPDKIGLSQYTTQEDAEKKIAKLPDAVQTQLLYLLIHSEKGASSGYWHSQAGIRAIAEEWNIGYQAIDAKVRVELSAKKHLKAHEEYLKAVETGQKNAVLPWLYSDKWKGD